MPVRPRRSAPAAVSVVPAASTSVASVPRGLDRSCDFRTLPARPGRGLLRLGPAVGEGRLEPPRVAPARPLLGDRPGAVPAAVQPAVGRHLFRAPEGPPERPRPFRETSAAPSRPRHGLFRLGIRVPDVAARPVRHLHPARDAARPLGAHGIAAELRRRWSTSRVCGAEALAGAPSPASRFRASARNAPRGYWRRYASKSAGSVLSRIDCQKRFSCAESSEADASTGRPKILAQKASDSSCLGPLVLCLQPGHHSAINVKPNELILVCQAARVLYNDGDLITEAGDEISLVVDQSPQFLGAARASNLPFYGNLCERRSD